jgi:polyhydroxyalkanoate synthesis regulator phasin
MAKELLKEWSFVFFDMGSNEAARRVRLLRGLRRIGAALRNQSVYCMPYSMGSFVSLKELDKDICVVKADVAEDDIEEMVEAYNLFISGVMKEVYEKLEALEDAKASAVDTQTKRGYTKRLNKMYERVDHLEYIAKLGQNDEAMDKVEEFKRQIIEIDDDNPGKLI